MKNGKPNISKRAFWWVDFDKIDYRTNKKWVIERICLDGKESDFFEILSFYGKEAVEAVISGRMEEIFNLRIANQFVMHEVAMLNFRKRQMEKGQLTLKCKQCGNPDEEKMTLCTHIKPKIVIYEIECHICEYKSKFEI